MHQAIADGRYRAIIVSPEQMMKDGGGFEALWKNEAFTSRIISIVWDEAHCISYWGEFRPEYKDAKRLRYLLPRHIPFYLASATLPPLVLRDVMDTLQINPSRHIMIHHSNDRSNIAISVRKMQFAASSYEDLLFLLPKFTESECTHPDNNTSSTALNNDPSSTNLNNDPSSTDLNNDTSTTTKSRPLKFLIFFDDIKDSVAAGKFLREHLPPEHRDKIRWYNADMSELYRSGELTAFTAGDRLGLLCTDSFGMVCYLFLEYTRDSAWLTDNEQGVDIPDIDLVVQWRATCNIATLWQRFGRAARDPELEGKALFLVEPKYFDDEKAKKEARRDKRAANLRKRKASQPTGTTSSKRRRVEGGAVIHSTSTRVPVPAAADREPSESGSDSDEDDDDLYAERRRLYQQETVPTTASRRDKQQKAKEMEPAMNDMINPGSAGLDCRRKPINICFENDKALRGM